MQRNVAGMERVASVVIGGYALANARKSNKSKTARAGSGSLGMALLWRGATGHCPVYQAMDVTTATASNKYTDIPLAKRSIVVNLPLDEVSTFLEVEETPYGYFTKVLEENMFEIDLGSTHWSLSLENHLDGLRTLIRTASRERFEITPPMASESMKKSTSIQLSSFSQIDLRQLKALMETGEIPTTEGQSSGKRSSLGHLAESFGDFMMHKIQSKHALPHSKFNSTHALNAPMVGAQT